MASQKVRITVFLSSSVLREVDRLARAARVSRSAYIEAVLRQHLRLKPLIALSF
jgi:metal-responsive CopG/Arc/MetJ family transcriptional regulator